MHAATLFSVEPPTGEAELESFRSDNEMSIPAMDVETQETLDGRSIAAGTAAGFVETVEVDPIIGVDDSGGVVVSDEWVETTEPVVTEYIADAGAGYIGLEKGDARFAADAIAQQWDVPVPVEARLDLDGFEAQFHGDASSDAWMTTGERVDDGDDGVEIAYHQDASLHDAGRRDLSGVGFEFGSEIGHVRGVAYESGYVAVFTELADIQFAEFCREHVVPFLERDPDGEREAAETLAATETEGA